MHIDVAVVAEVAVSSRSVDDLAELFGIKIGGDASARYMNAPARYANAWPTPPYSHVHSRQSQIGEVDPSMQAAKNRCYAPLFSSFAPRELLRPVGPSEARRPSGTERSDLYGRALQILPEPKPIVRDVEEVLPVLRPQRSDRALGGGHVVARSLLRVVQPEPQRLVPIRNHPLTERLYELLPDDVGEIGPIRRPDRIEAFRAGWLGDVDTRARCRAASPDLLALQGYGSDSYRSHIRRLIRDRKFAVRGGDWIAQRPVRKCRSEQRGPSWGAHVPEVEDTVVDDEYRVVFAEGDRSESDPPFRPPPNRKDEVLIVGPETRCAVEFEPERRFSAVDRVGDEFRCPRTVALECRDNAVKFALEYPARIDRDPRAGTRRATMPLPRSLLQRRAACGHRLVRSTRRMSGS